MLALARAVKIPLPGLSQGRPPPLNPEASTIAALPGEFRSTRGPDRVFAVLRGLVFVAGALLVVFGLATDTLGIPLTRFRVESTWVMVAGLLIAGGSFVLRHLPPQAVLPPLILVWSTVAILFVDFRPTPVRGETLLSFPRRPAIVFQSQHEWMHDFFIGHPRFGHALRPRVRARHHHPEFDVQYTIGKDGWRITPAPTEPVLGDILFVGCSYTFGHGVKDEETYPYLLGQKAWPHFHVHNCAVMGWGTTQARLALEELLVRYPQTKVVFYGMIGDHLRRNYRRQSWHGTNPDASFPLFERKGETFVFTGLASNTKGDLPDSPELDRTERELTAQLLSEMRELCRAKGVRFVILALDPGLDAVFSMPKSKDCFVLDLSGVSNSYFASDGHPRAPWHRAVAAAIAGEPEMARRLEIPDLYAPQSIDPPEEHDFWRLRADPRKAWVRWTAVRQPSGPIELSVKSVPDVPATAARLALPWLPIVRGRNYRIRCRARCDREQPVPVICNGAVPPWTWVGCPKATWTMTPEWQDFAIDFQATQSEANCHVAMLLGGIDSSIEVDDFHVLENGNELLPNRPKPHFYVAGTKRP